MQPLPTTNKLEATPIRKEPKQPWRKPVLTFVPLQMTAVGSGPDLDGEAGTN